MVNQFFWVKGGKNQNFVYAVGVGFAGPKKWVDLVSRILLVSTELY
jgi:hypothetical protein